MKKTLIFSIFILVTSFAYSAERDFGFDNDSSDTSEDEIVVIPEVSVEDAIRDFEYKIMQELSHRFTHYGQEVMPWDNEIKNLAVINNELKAMLEERISDEKPVDQYTFLEKTMVESKFDFVNKMATKRMARKRIDGKKSRKTVWRLFQLRRAVLMELAKRANYHGIDELQESFRDEIDQDNELVNSLKF